MLTSLFSPFDALLAEAIGQKVGLSCFSGATEVAAEAKHAAVSDPKASPKEAVKKDREVSSAPPPSPHVKKPQNQQGQQRRTPRFALELDGVDWFETIVPY